MEDYCKFEDKIGNMHDSILVMREDIKYIRKELEGNGKPGLIQQVKENTEWKWRIIGGGIALMTAMTILNVTGVI